MDYIRRRPLWHGPAARPTLACSFWLIAARCRVASQSPRRPSTVADLRLPDGVGDKRVLRTLALGLGLSAAAAGLPKRSIQ